MTIIRNCLFVTYISIISSGSLFYITIKTFYTERFATIFKIKNIWRFGKNFESPKSSIEFSLTNKLLRFF